MFLKRYKNLYKFKPYFAKYKGLIAILVICMVIASSMGMVLAYLMSEQLSAISNIEISNMIKFTILIVAAVFIHHLTWFYWDKISAIIGNKIARDIRKDILENTLSTKYQVVKEKSTGFYLERLNDDTNEVSFFVQNVAGTLVDVFTNVCFLIIIFFLNWQCGLLFTCGLVVLYLFDLWKIKCTLKHTKKIKVLSEQMDSKMNEVVRGIKDIKGLGIKEEAIKQNTKINEEFSKQNTKMKCDVTLLERARTFTQWLIDALLVLVCAFWLFPTGQITVVVILIIFNYKSLMYDTIGFFSQIKGYYVQGDFKASRILEIINDDNKEIFGDEPLSNNNSIEVKNLSFAYQNKKVLENISFSLVPNTASVLVGASGSGKSTLFSLLTKLNDVEDKKIFIGNKDINKIDEQNLKENVSIVNQEPFVFNASIMDNLKIVRPNATDREIFDACKKANIHNEITEMEDGYNTILTENGNNLSGGQKQRLSIARAILKNTKIILFDEPTSALDKENQTLFLQTIQELKTAKTIFVIAHKLNDLSMFDQVLELKNGQINIIKAD